MLFEYDPSRAGAVAERLLDGFGGVLQAYGYSGYSKVCQAVGITRIGCCIMPGASSLKPGGRPRPRAAKIRLGNPPRSMWH